MKKCIALLVFFLGFNSQVFSQEKNDSYNLTSSKWKIESIQIGQEVINLTEDDDWMIFRKDGSYEIYLDHNSKTGIWSLDKDKNLKFDLEDANVNKLSENRLEFSLFDFTLALIKSEKNI